MDRAISVVNMGNSMNAYTAVEGFVNTIITRIAHYALSAILYPHTAHVSYAGEEIP